jgi:hypothetical protein
MPAAHKLGGGMVVVGKKVCCVCVEESQYMADIAKWAKYEFGWFFCTLLGL